MDTAVVEKMPTAQQQQQLVERGPESMQIEHIFAAIEATTQQLESASVVDPESHVTSKHESISGNIIPSGAPSSADVPPKQPTQQLVQSTKSQPDADSPEISSLEAGKEPPPLQLPTVWPPRDAPARAATFEAERQQLLRFYGADDLLSLLDCAGMH